MLKKQFIHSLRKYGEESFPNTFSNMLCRSNISSEKHYNLLIRNYLSKVEARYVGIDSNSSCQDIIEMYRYLLGSMRDCNTLYESLEHLSLFYDCFSRKSRLHISQDNECVILRFHNHVSDKHFSPQQQRVITVNIMLAIKGLMNWLTKCDINLVKAALVYEKPGSKQDESLFNCPVVYRSKNTSLWFSVNYANFPIKADQAMIDQFMKDAPASLFCQRKSHSLKEQIESIVSHRNYNELPSLDDIATLLNISKSRLYAELKKEGVSFKAIKNARIRQLSIAYVQHTDLKISNISRKLGFSSPGSFYRFFRDNTGVTPSQYRQNHSNKASHISSLSIDKFI